MSIGQSGFKKRREINMMKRLLASLLTGVTALSFTGYGAPASDTTAVQAVQKRPDISAREAISSGFAVGRAACC